MSHRIIPIPQDEPETPVELWRLGWMVVNPKNPRIRGTVWKTYSYVTAGATKAEAKALLMVGTEPPAGCDRARGYVELVPTPWRQQ